MTLNHSPLFAPVHIGNLKIRNRIVRSATAERLATEPMGRATPQLADLYRQLAEGGVGLIITGHAYIAPEGKAHPEMLAAHCDQMIPGLESLATAAHAGGAHIALQINHAGRQANDKIVTQPLAPSPVPAHAGRIPREMTNTEILDTISAFGDAARRAQAAGMDAVQLHGAHGYLIGQFLSPMTNHRTDRWGGNLERRTRFLAAVSEEVRGQVGQDYPVFIKLGMEDKAPEGLSASDGADIAGKLADWGLDAIEVSGGYGDGSDFSTRLGVGTRTPEAYFRHLAQRASHSTSLPLILVGGLRQRSTMEGIITSGDAALVAMCRPLICEPDLPRRLESGQTQAAACISANRCWPNELGEGIGCKCLN